MAKKKSKQGRRAEELTRQNKKEKTWDLAWKILASVFSFAGSMVAVYELVNYFRSDSKTFYSLIIPGLAIIIWSAVLFQLFRKKNPYAILLLVITILGGVVGWIGWQAYNQAREDKVIVLIAQFDGPEETYGLRRQMMEDLREATKEYDDTVIIEGDELVTSSQHARELGEKAKADLVIWAWYRPTENPNITIHIENLSPTEFETIEESETYKPQATLDQLESFEIQRQLGSETSTLVTFLTGMLRYKNYDFQKAIERFEQVLDENDISTFIDLSDIYFNLGYSYLQMGNYRFSIQYYDKSIEINPQDEIAYSIRGIAYVGLGDYQRAIQDLDMAIQINPYSADAYHNRGSIYFSLSDYQRAIQDYDKALQINPLLAEAYQGRGSAYFNLDKYQRAIQDFDKAIQINPLFAEAYGNRGLAYNALSEYQHALQDFDKVIEINPQDARAYNSRGLTYINLEDYELAIRDFDKAIKINPQYANAYHRRGIAYGKLDRYQIAIEEFNKAIQIDPYLANAYYGRGLAYQALGKTTEAEADFKKYEELTGQKP